MKNKLDFDIIDEIHDGMSKDEKYIVFLKKWNKKCFLRVSLYTSDKLLHYALLFKVYKEPNVSKLIYYFVKNNKIYAFFEFIEGYVLKNIIDKFSDYQKFEYGRQMGLLLRNIHISDVELNIKLTNLELVDSILDGYVSFDKKCKSCDYLFLLINKYKNYVNFDDYVYLNSDFHWMNMMIDNNNIVLIDFEKFEFGNKCRDFTFIYTCNEDKYFASGQIDGYFNNRIVPLNFWIEFKFFSLLYVLNYYMWNIKKFKKLNDSLIIVDKIINDYVDNEFIPKWYRECKIYE